MSVKPESGGVCAPQGFLAAGMSCGGRSEPARAELAIVYSSVPCSAAAVYTPSRLRGAGIGLTRQHIANGKAQAVVCCGGVSNALAPGCDEAARAVCAAAGDALRVTPTDIAFICAGTPGKALDVARMEDALPEVSARLSQTGSLAAATAIVTAGGRPAEVAVSFPLGDRICKIGGIAGGSASLSPDLATLLCFITTDASISTPMLQRAMDAIIPATFHMISLGGAPSPNDMAVALANGLAANTRIDAPGEEYDSFLQALMQVCIFLARSLSQDTSGVLGRRLLECVVTGAASDEAARALAKAVVSARAVRRALASGSDEAGAAILLALGAAGVPFEPAATRVVLSADNRSLTVCDEGFALPLLPDEARSLLTGYEPEVSVTLQEGDGGAVAWGRVGS